MYHEPVIQQLKDPLFEEKEVDVYIKREDLVHPTVSGNKWRKLKYNLINATKEEHDTLLTFGGAFSNHLYATAAAAHQSGFKSIGIIRGEELRKKPLNPTLQFAQANGMQLHFITRADYQKKSSAASIEHYHNIFGRCYLLPEGGTNMAALKGCQEILGMETKAFHTICVSVGTGGTMAGIVTAALSSQHVLGFSALKGNFLQGDVRRLVSAYNGQNGVSWNINNQYHFGGYAKVSQELMNFIRYFEKQHSILLDHVYTGKMMFGIYDLIRKDYFKEGSKLLAIHTGGLQGRQQPEVI